MPEGSDRRFALVALAAWLAGLFILLALDSDHTPGSGTRGVAAAAVFGAAGLLASWSAFAGHRALPDAALLATAGFGAVRDPGLADAAALTWALAASALVLGGHAILVLEKRLGRAPPGRRAGPLKGPLSSRVALTLLATTAATAIVVLGPGAAAGLVSPRWALSLDAWRLSLGALGALLVASALLGLRMVLWSRAGRPDGSSTDAPEAPGRAERATPSITPLP